MKHITKVIVVSMVMLLSSCNEWLSIAPQNDLIKEKFWTKSEDVESSLAAAYDALRSASLQSLIFGELRADIATFNGTSFSSYDQIAGSNISSTNWVINWSNYYRAINLANTLMFFDDDVAEIDQTFTKDIQDGIEAEARFIRSLSYFYLVRLWKDVPLMTEAAISDTSDIYVPKSTEYEVIDFIIEDLHIAKDLAYTDEFMGSDYFYGRANKYAIMALLADVYLWNEEYEKAIDYCDSIMETGLFSLEPTNTYFDVFYPGNSPREAIFEVQYDDNLDGQNNPIYGDLIPVQGSPQVSLDGQSVNLIMETEDKRRFSGKGAYWKYLGKDAFGLLRRTPSERDANWIIYRYADIMLIKAEASVELGDFGTANELIGETLLRAEMPFTDLNDKELLRQEILDERGREFMLEGKRWFDILRAAKRNDFQRKQLIIDMLLSGADIKQQAVLRTRVYDTMSYYLPIPEHELKYNQNLVQNPFYDR
ncbi:RagB/SusD family nutrient uptake outer membrane protein [Bacteroidota bacterium]